VTETTSDSLFDPAVQDCPYAHYRWMRESAPVHLMPDTGYYVLSRYEDVRAVMMDPQTFSSEYDYAQLASFNQGPMGIIDAGLAERGWAHVETLQRRDPPGHTRDRRLIKRLFTNRAMRALSADISAQANLLIDSFIDVGRCDFVSEFAVPFPALVMAGQLGLAEERLPTLQRWVDGMLAPVTRRINDAEAQTALEAELEAQHYFAALFEQRRREPREDIISWLVADHDEHFTERELQSLMRFLLTGGLNTTAHALAHGMLLLVTYPDHWSALADDPLALDRFIEEVIRLEGPVQGLFRRTTRDVQMHDVKIPAGSFVMIRHGAANHDPATFADPETFDPARENLTQHVGFGAGVHYCVGAPLAREEMRVAFRRLLERLDSPRLAAPLPTPAHAPSLMFRGLVRLDLCFDTR
jgi:cytochrome P450